MTGKTAKRLPYKDYYLAIRRARNFEWQREWEKVLANQTASNLALKSEKVPTTVVGNMKLS